MVFLGQSLIFFNLTVLRDQDKHALLVHICASHLKRFDDRLLDHLTILKQALVQLVAEYVTSFDQNFGVALPYTNLLLLPYRLDSARIVRLTLAIIFFHHDQKARPEQALLNQLQYRHVSPLS